MVEEVVGTLRGVTVIELLADNFEAIYFDGIKPFIMRMPGRS